MWWILKKKCIYVFVLYLFSSHLPFMLPWTLNLNGSYTQRRNKSLLIDSGKDGNQPREGSDPVYSAFQITEDTRLRRLRSIRTPCYSNTSLKRPWSLKILGYINIFLSVLLISHMRLIAHRSPLCGSSFSEVGFLSATTPVKTSRRGVVVAPSISHFLPHLLFSCLPHTGHLKAFHHFSLLPVFSPYQNPPGTSRFIPRSQLKVQVLPSVTLWASSHQANNNISHATTIIIRWLQRWCGSLLLKSVYKIKTT